MAHTVDWADAVILSWCQHGYAQRHPPGKIDSDVAAFMVTRLSPIFSRWRMVRLLKWPPKGRRLNRRAKISLYQLQWRSSSSLVQGSSSHLMGRRRVGISDRETNAELAKIGGGGDLASSASVIFSRDKWLRITGFDLEKILCSRVSATWLSRDRVVHC